MDEDRAGGRGDARRGRCDQESRVRNESGGWRVEKDGMQNGREPALKGSGGKDRWREERVEDGVGWRGTKEDGERGRTWRMGRA